MVTLNHTNLTTFDVPALTQFFCSVFAFQVTQQRTDKLAVLQNSDGFLLTLMYDKQMSAGHGYPGMFHIGFRQPTPNDVDSMHAELTAHNYAAPKPEKLQRGGPAAYGFYCNAPGGVVVEVSTMNIDPS